MKIGIIAEGRSDQAVLTNILKAKSFDQSDLVYLRPELEFDETDLNNPKIPMSARQFSNWLLVKEECQKTARIEEFLTSFVDDRFLIIQIDSAETHLKGYEVTKPDKKSNPDYYPETRKKIIEKINEWLNNRFQDKFFYAVTVEETEAWVLTIYSTDNKETGYFNDPKKELENLLLKKLSRNVKNKIDGMKAYDKFLELSKPFRKKKDLEKFILKNQSFKAFYESLNPIEEVLKNESK